MAVRRARLPAFSCFERICAGLDGEASDGEPAFPHLEKYLYVRSLAWNFPGDAHTLITQLGRLATTLVNTHDLPAR